MREVQGAELHLAEQALKGGGVSTSDAELQATRVPPLPLTLCLPLPLTLPLPLPLTLTLTLTLT